MSINLVEKNEREQEGGQEYRTELKTRNARNTGRKIGRKDSIQTQHRLMETGKQTRIVREGDQGYY